MAWFCALWPNERQGALRICGEYLFRGPTSEVLVHEEQEVRGRAMVGQVLPQAIYDGALREAIFLDALDDAHIYNRVA